MSVLITMFKIKLALPIALASILIGSFTLPIPVKAQSGDRIDCRGMYHTDGRSYDLGYDSEGGYYYAGNQKKRVPSYVRNPRQNGTCRSTQQYNNRQNRSQSEKLRQDRQNRSQSEKLRQDRQNRQEWSRCTQSERIYKQQQNRQYRCTGAIIS